MSSKKLQNVNVGDTIRLTWVSSGAIASDIYAAIKDGDEILVHSESMISSGNGFYYLDYTVPGSSGYYVSDMIGTIDGKPYVRKLKFKTVTGEVD